MPLIPFRVSLQPPHHHPQTSSGSPPPAQMTCYSTTNNFGVIARSQSDALFELTILINRVHTPHNRTNHRASYIIFRRREIWISGTVKV